MAKSKIITYDLCAPGRNYDDLYEKIKSYGVWAHIMDSAWYISSSDSCAAIRDNLSSVLDSSDKLFVAELTDTAAWLNLPKDISDYLKKNL